MFGRFIKGGVFVALLSVVLAGAASAALLEDLVNLPQEKTMRVSSYDVTGENADGSQNHKVQPGEVRTIADITGPGRIAHIWVTMSQNPGDNPLTDVILRMYWDGEKTPSVEAPIGEFFGLGHGKYYTYESLPLVIGNLRGLNCYFQMPFGKSAKITIEHTGKSELRSFYYYVDYQKLPKAQKGVGYFHAQYRQEKPTLSKGNYVILDAAGRGRYVGCFMFVCSNAAGWWGEGDDMIYIDGSEKPVLNGTGTEDYFNQAWGVAQGQHTMRFGSPLDEGRAIGSLHSVYRFHLEDAISFEKSIKVTIEHGHANNKADDFSSIAYWYQTEPHADFPALPKLKDRMPSVEPLKVAQ